MMEPRSETARGDGAREYSDRLARGRQRGLDALERAAHVSGRVSGLQGPALYRQLSGMAADLLQVEIAAILLYDAGPAQELVAQAHAVGIPDDLLAAYRIPLGEGSPAQSYWQGADPLVINEAQADPLVRELGLDWLARRLGVRSTMLCGLLHEGQLIGLIQVCNKVDGSGFDREDIRLLRIFGRQAAVTIQNAELLQEIQRHVDEAASLSSLYRMTSALAQALDLETMLAVVLQHVRRVLDYDSGLVFLATTDGQALRVEAVDSAPRTASAPGTASAGGLEPMLGVDTPVDSGINGWIFSQGKPLLVADADLDPRRVHIKGRTESIRAAIGAPLIADGQVIGTIYATRQQPNSFTEAHLDFLTFTAAQVAAGVQRARLLDRARRRAEEMETLLSTAAVMASAMEQDQILLALYEQAGRIMDTSAFFVAIYDPDADAIRFPLIYDLGRRLEPFVIRFSESRGLAAYTIRSACSLLIRDWPEESLAWTGGGRAAPLEPMVIGEPARSWLAVPIVVQDKVLGALGAQSYEPHAFTARHERLLLAIASQAGISLQNARLLADLKLVNTDLQEMVTAQAHLLQTIETTIAALDAAEDLEGLRRQLGLGALGHRRAGVRAAGGYLAGGE